MPVGEAFLSAFLQVALDRLTPTGSNLLDFARSWKVESDLKNLIRILRKINAVLNDAEEKQSKDEAVKEWLDELTDVVYDADDVVDEFATETLRWKLLEGTAETTQTSPASQVWDMLTSSVCHFVFNGEIKDKIKEITDRLDDIAKLRHALGLRDGVKGRSYAFQERLQTTSLVNESFVYGRDKEKEKIIDLLLLQEEPRHNEISVIPIVGMGGVGKTTLAQLVYNDDSRVKGHFNMKAWVCVSDEFHVIRITKAILESATKRSHDLKNLEPLQVTLKNELYGKKFLLVLDDVWNKNYTDWDDLRKPFSAGAKGSKIIVTTRDKKVATTMAGPSVPIHYLKHLSEDDSWSLFEKHAFENTNRQPKLESIGREIVKKCKGLPLAAKTLAGLLRCRVEEYEWEDILNSELWDLPDEESGIIPALKLSYHHLPAHLKRCFAYCAIFPKDFEFAQEDMVLLWMAEGFLQRSKGRKEMEELGREYFSELLSRSFFQQSSGRYTGGRFVMHDLINDLAQCVAGDICLKLEDADRQNGTLEKARHSSYARTQYDDGSKKFEAFYKVKALRTLLSLPLRGLYGDRISIPMSLQDLLPKLSFLRALSLAGYCIKELPDSIGDLKLLRYLNLSYTEIIRLPQSTGNLYNLQSLLLYECRSLLELPSNMRNLINLRHLDIRRTNLEGMPLQMGKLTNLRTLGGFVVGKGSGYGIGELEDLLHLQGTLRIRNLNNVIDVGDATKANLKDKKDLDKLVMRWSRGFDDKLEDVLNELRPHENLRKLVINYYGGTSFPSWIGDPSFSNLMSLKLSNCKNCTSLPPVGALPSLKDLAIRAMNGVKHVGVEFYGAGNVSVKPFPSLESLVFSGLSEWEEWFYPSSSTDHGGFKLIFPCLRALSIRSCPKLLRKFPGHRPPLEKLLIHNCPQLILGFPRLPSSCEIDTKEYKEVVFTNNSVDLTNSRRTRLELINCDTDALMSLLNEGRLEHVVDLNCLSIGISRQQFLYLPNLCLLGNGLNDLQLLFSSCSSLNSFPRSESSIKLNLYIRDFKYSVFEGIMHINSTSLSSLHIEGCSSLTSFSEVVLPATLKTLELCNCENLESMSEVTMPSNMSLRTFKAIKCPNLRSLPEGLHNLTKLETVEIKDCDSLVSFLDGGLPTSLASLSIFGCKNLNLIPLSQWRLHQLTSLRQLTLGGECPDLVSFTESLLPISLASLGITECPKLTVAPPKFPVTLETLWLCECENLESLSEVTMTSNMSLRQFYAINCPNLKSLPEGLHNLSKLTRMEIKDCHSLVSFPDGGLPASLEDLSIVGCNNLNRMPLSEWRLLHQLTSLKRLTLGGGCPDLVSFPEWLLPTSLTYLWVKDLPNLETLSIGLQNRTSFKDLWIHDCPKIKFLPGVELLAGLSYLTIRNCPMLEERYEKEKGEDWQKISHIPFIQIN